MRQERGVPAMGYLDETGGRQRRGQCAPGSGGREPVALSRDDQRRLRDAGEHAAQVGRAQDLEARGQRARVGRTVGVEVPPELAQRLDRALVAARLQREEVLHRAAVVLR